MSELQSEYDQMFEEHTLTEIVNNGPVGCWNLERHPGSRMYLVQVTSTPEGIAIQGDSIPGSSRGGVFATAGGITWFVSEMDPDYLADKFLTRQWTREAAETHFKRLVQQLTQMGEHDLDPGATEAAQALRRQATQHQPFSSPMAWERAFGSVLMDLVDGIGQFDGPKITSDEAYPAPAWDGDDVAMLVAIHARFRSLFLEQYSIQDNKPVARVDK